MDLANAFMGFTQQEGLLENSDKILLAVSGGIDSMVMLNLFIRNDIPVSVAHCNFMLRGEESDQDEAFVEETAEKQGIPIHIRQFDTEGYAEDNRLSVQMAARELRFSWFDELHEKFGYTKIALGHNQDDIAETFFINLSRGTGLRGLSGMDIKRGIYIRPIAFARRKNIEAYARDHQVSYREDSSNASLKYTRNKIRHQVLPMLEEIHTHFHTNLIDTISHLHDAEIIYKQAIDKAQTEFLTKENEIYKISIPQLKNTGNPQIHLFETLRPFGFTREQIQEIGASLDKAPGKQFFSPISRLVKDRDQLILTPVNSETKPDIFYIEAGQTEVAYPVKLSISLKEKDEIPEIKSSPHYAFLDYDKLSFPLILRKWRKGDYFMPLGMKGLKKLSDFFVDLKMSLVEKEQTWLLTSGEKIVWVVGKRIDERFKITDQTRNILVIESRN